MWKGLPSSYRIAFWSFLWVKYGHNAEPLNMMALWNEYFDCGEIMSKWADEAPIKNVIYLIGF